MMNDTEEHDALEALEEKIKNAKGGKKKEPSEIAKTLNAGMDFTAPIIGAIVLGYFLDNWLDTKPVFIITFFLLGVGAGFTNLYKASQNIGGTIGYSELHRRQKNAKTSPTDDSSCVESLEKTD